LFVLNGTTLGEYTTSGATVNAALITGLANPDFVAVSGSYLFISENIGTLGDSTNSSYIDEYTTSGELVNAAFVSGLNQPYGIALGSEAITSPNLNATDTPTMPPWGLGVLVVLFMMAAARFLPGGARSVDSVE
jgi:hypothetical protein